MKDIAYIAAFPKSGITYLNYMLFHVLFDRPQDAGKIDSDYIFDLHESLPRVPPPGDVPCYVKSHFAYSGGLPLRQRAARAVYLWRDPIDVMMSIWDFKHLLGEDELLDASPAEEEGKFQLFCKHWVTTGGMIYPFAGSWMANVGSWLDQTDVPTLVVGYERLKARPFEELKRILRFLGREADDERVNAAVEAGRPENMRKRESEEIDKGVPGVLYRPGLERGYSRGYRFVGRMHEGSSEKVLAPAARQYASQVFGPLVERARSRAEDPGVRHTGTPAPQAADVAAVRTSAAAGGRTNEVNDIFCTYFDHNYLSRAMLMIESLRRFDSEKPIYVLALSELCVTLLRELALPKVEIIPLAELEATYPELTEVKPARKTIEYYFTLSPFLPHYLFDRTAADRITYVDADLYFFTSPQPVLDSLGEASVAITPHRFSFAYRNHVVYGLFNVAWITYRRCPEGLDCLNTYKAECIEWCYDRLENGRFGDQKYLDHWPSRYPSLRVINHKGVNLAMWNVQGHLIRCKNNLVMIDDDPLVFYHYSPTQILPDGSVNIPVEQSASGRSKAVLLEHVINPYKRRLEEQHRLLQQRFPALAGASREIRYPPGEPLPAYLAEAR
jgi:Sulfotransferase domain